MRITNKMLCNSFLSDMKVNLENMKKLQQQMTSGKEIRKPSDDPLKVARSMQLYRDISVNKQYNRNISDTINWLDTTDTALGQMGDVLHRVRELLISAGNGGYSENERLAIKDEINEKIGEMGQILNTNFDGAYIFGGTRGTTKPVDVNGGVDYSKASRIECSNIWTNAKISFTYKEGTTDKKIDIDMKDCKNNIVSVAAEVNKQLEANADFKGKLKVVPNISENSLMVLTERDDIKYTLENNSIYTTDISLKDDNVINIENNKDKSIEIGSSKISIDKNQKDIDLIISKIESEINKNPELEEKVKIQKNGNGFKVISSDPNVEVKVDNDTSDTTNPKKINHTNSSVSKTDKPINKVSLSSLENAQIVYYKKGEGFLETIDDPTTEDGMQYNQIGAKLKVQISQGVIMDYNVTATEVLKFTNEKGDSKDLKTILNNITNHLDGKDDNGVELSKDAIKELVEQDLQDITDVMNNILKIRSEVGAKQNRMDSAREQNVDANFNMTEILSKNEDIDITEKTMEVAVMQTVYVASLQASARIIQPSLMDYLR